MTLSPVAGYGGVSPRTQLGRIVALVYALFGIPIILLYLSAMGEYLSSAMHSLFRLLKISSASSGAESCGKKAKSSEKKLGPDKHSLGYHKDEEKLKKYFQPPGPAAGGFGNSNNVNRRYSTSSSLSTAMSTAIPTVPISVCILILIAYVALGAALFSKLQRWTLLESLYFCFASLSTIGAGDLQPLGGTGQYVASAYILFGMAVVAMCFSLIQTELVSLLRRFGVQDQPPAYSKSGQSKELHQTPSQPPPQFMIIDRQGDDAQAADDLALVTVTMTPPKIP